ncbi:hypothetical protein BGX38DRAFT_1275450 [Terfezia claveryi]|nr:hypothetical protein BGX38DRAFT_1275450 [Terfezia claveryi]
MAWRLMEGFVGSVFCFDYLAPHISSGKEVKKGGPLAELVDAANPLESVVCPLLHAHRQALGSIKDWEDLDRPIWIEEEEEDNWDAVEAFFGFLYKWMVGRRH